jgi:hypothetical protein
MALQNFVDNTLPTIKAVFLNQVDAFVNTLFNASTTAAQARTAIGATSTGTSLFTAADAVSARAVLGSVAYSRVQGLIGNVNVSTPLTKYDISADAVVAKDSTGSCIVKVNTGALTNDFGLAGITANGRDQVSAFSASSWVHLYFIMKVDGTIATISSLTAPPTGPTLPTGYTYWAYAGTLRWNSSSNIVAAYFRGNLVTYRQVIAVLTGGTATTETSINLSTVVPPNALNINLQGRVLASDASGPTINVVEFRLATTLTYFNIEQDSQVLSVGNYNDLIFSAPNISQNIFYLFTTKNGNTSSVSVSCHGFTIPNGG